MLDTAEPQWKDVGPIAELAAKSQLVTKINGRQILLLHHKGQVFACNNRCPHEGHPLAKGVLGDDCRLTCNWHNWKFDLITGETIKGGDALRRYPVRIVDGVVSIDVTDPPVAEIREASLAGLFGAFDEHDYTRLARETARYERAHGDYRELLTAVFARTADRLEYGTTHAHAAAPDWLALRDRIPEDRPADRLVPLIEVIGHASWDCLLQPGAFPLTGETAVDYDAAPLEDAIEAEDEVLAISIARAGLAEGGGNLLKPALERAAFRHYQGFGHSVIYTSKTYELLNVLGPAATEALVLPLVRYLCHANREDLIPEFRSYAPALAAWDGEGRSLPSLEDFHRKGVAACLELIQKGSADIEGLYHTLFQAAAASMLHYDATYRNQIDGPVGHNIDWLDFSHALTHLNASRKICAQQSDLWPAALLQAGCFLGRNASFVDWTQDTDRWAVSDTDAFFDTIFDRLLDHGQPTYIFVAHTMKLTSALRQEISVSPNAPWVPTALAALNRFVNEPAKQKHVRRSAHQAWDFIAGSGE
ncbi:MAG: Rieske (2Fe-2S) protein [Pseudomonadota bacterium]